MNLEKGGRGAIERMVEAYGFKTRQALCDHLAYRKAPLQHAICVIHSLQNG